MALEFLNLVLWWIVGWFVGFGVAWIITAVCWFRIDRRVRPLRLRIWRSVSWLPLTIRNRIKWGRW